MGIINAIVILGGMGLVFGLILAFSSRVFAVDKDDRSEILLKALPGVNCGSCGYASCEVYAQAMAGEGISPDLCKVGGEKLNIQLCEILGIKHKKGTRMTVMVSCSGGVRALEKYDYTGLNDCAAALKIAGGPKDCEYGCMGLGSCVEACPFGAISIAEGVAVVDHERCTGCFTCVEVCPKQIISPVPYYADVNVACSSQDKGGNLRKICDIGCLGCKICEKICETGAIQVKDNLASIDHEKCTGCGDCAEKCPRKLIVDAKLDREPRMMEDN